MGAQKALLPWAGATLLEYQLQQLAALDDVTEIIVVTGYDAEKLAPIIDAAPKARRAHNARYDDGKAGSVKCGLAAVTAAAGAILLLAVDQPRPAPLLRALLDAHRDARAPISAPVFDRHRGHPLIFDRALLPELQAIDEQSQGVRAVLARHASHVNDVPVSDPVACLDVNTPEDLERGREMLRGGDRSAS
jgi:CTP:molybdopterin cytidylyltransferase MocA